MWSPCNLSTPSSTLPLKRGTNIPVCPSIATASDLHTALGRHVNQDSHTTSRDLKKSGQTSSIPGALLLSSWSTKFVASLPVRGHYSPSSTDSASITHILTLGLRRSLVCFFHHFTISSVEVSSVPRTVVLSVSRAPVPPSELSEICQNCCEVDQKYFSMVYRNFSHIWFFASATARAELHLACSYLYRPTV